MRVVAMGSRAEHGSSMRMTSGWVAMARAMHRRCCWPPDISRAELFSRFLTSSHRAALRRACSTISCMSPFMLAIFGPKATLSKIDLGNGFGFWNTIPIRRRTSTGSTASS